MNLIDHFGDFCLFFGREEWSLPLGDLSPWIWPADRCDLRTNLAGGDLVRRTPGYP